MASEAESHFIKRNPNVDLHALVRANTSSDTLESHTIVYAVLMAFMDFIDEKRPWTTEEERPTTQCFATVAATVISMTRIIKRNIWFNMVIKHSLIWDVPSVVLAILDSGLEEKFKKAFFVECGTHGKDHRILSIVCNAAKDMEGELCMFTNAIMDWRCNDALLLYWAEQGRVPSLMDRVLNGDTRQYSRIIGSTFFYSVHKTMVRIFSSVSRKCQPDVVIAFLTAAGPHFKQYFELSHTVMAGMTEEESRSCHKRMTKAVLAMHAGVFEALLPMMNVGFLTGAEADSTSRPYVLFTLAVKGKTDHLRILLESPMTILTPEDFWRTHPALTAMTVLHMACIKYLDNEECVEFLLRNAPPGIVDTKGGFISDSNLTTLICGPLMTPLSISKFRLCERAKEKPIALFARCAKDRAAAGTE